MTQLKYTKEIRSVMRQADSIIVRIPMEAFE